MTYGLALFGNENLLVFREVLLDNTSNLLENLCALILRFGGPRGKGSTGSSYSFVELNYPNLIKRCHTIYRRRAHLLLGRNRDLSNLLLSSGVLDVESRGRSNGLAVDGVGVLSHDVIGGAYIVVDLERRGCVDLGLYRGEASPMAQREPRNVSN